jgi:hypothetical protein
MKDAHNHLKLDDMHFNVFKENFLEVLKENKVALSIVGDVSR